MSYKQNVLIETSNICFKNFMFLILNFPFLYAMKFRIKRFKDMYIKRYIFSLLSLTMTKWEEICIFKACIAYEGYWPLSILFQVITGFKTIWMLRVSTCF